MVNYFEGLRQASFRGVPFEVPDDGTSFGRRTVTHEYPGRDEPYHEDLGLSAQKFSIEAVVAGADFKSAASALESALKKKGPGTLIHPHYGELEVVTISADRRHSTDSAGEIRFSISFEKYGAPLYPSQTRDTASALTTAGDSAFTAIQSDFIEHFNIGGVPDFIVQDAAGRALDFSDKIKAALSSRSLLRSFTGDWPHVWDVSDASDLASGVVDFIRTIGSIAVPATVPMVGAEDETIPADALTVIEALAESSAYSIADASAADTPNQSIRVANADALDYLFRTSVLAATVQAARTAEYDSREQAIDLRSSMADDIDAVRSLLGAAGWDRSWQAAGNLTAALSRDINERIGRLPRTVTIRAAAVRPSLALANRLYGDDPSAVFDRASDLVTRNGVRHPGFVPVQDLEVLIDAA